MLEYIVKRMLRLYNLPSFHLALFFFSVCVFEVCNLFSSRSTASSASKT